MDVNVRTLETLRTLDALLGQSGGRVAVPALPAASASTTLLPTGYSETRNWYSPLAQQPVTYSTGTQTAETRTKSQCTETITQRTATTNTSSVQTTSIAVQCTPTEDAVGIPCSTAALIEESILRCCDEHFRRFTATCEDKMSSLNNRLRNLTTRFDATLVDFINLQQMEAIVRNEQVARSHLQAEEANSFSILCIDALATCQSLLTKKTAVRSQETAQQGLKSSLPTDHHADFPDLLAECWELLE